jgi:hypothetical protein
MDALPKPSEQGACLPTQRGMNRQPSAATRLTQEAVKFP